PVILRQLRPPGVDRCRVVGAPRSDALARKGLRVAEPGRVLLPGQDAIARHPELPHRLAHERRNDAEVLGDDPRPGDRLRRARQLVEHHAEDAASPRALPLSAGRVEATAVDAVSAPDPLPEVADHVIEAEAVVEAGAGGGGGPRPRTAPA